MFFVTYWKKPLGIADTGTMKKHRVMKNLKRKIALKATEMKIKPANKENKSERQQQSVIGRVVCTSAIFFLAVLLQYPRTVML